MLLLWILFFAFLAVVAMAPKWATEVGLTIAWGLTALAIPISIVIELLK